VIGTLTGAADFRASSRNSGRSLKTYLIKICRKVLTNRLRRRETGLNAKPQKNYQLPAIAAVAAISTPIAASVATTAASASTTTSAPASTTTAAVPATSTARPAASTGASAFRLRPRFIDDQISPAKILPVKRIHGAICVFIVIYLHERKPARLSRKTVANQIYIPGSNTDLREPLVKLLFCSGKRKITDIKLLHLPTPPVRNPTASPRSALKKSCNWSRVNNYAEPNMRPDFSGQRHPLQNSLVLQPEMIFVTGLIKTCHPDGSGPTFIFNFARVWRFWKWRRNSFVFTHHIK
jgi:hypothetical protein